MPFLVFTISFDYRWETDSFCHTLEYFIIQLRVQEYMTLFPTRERGRCIRWGRETGGRIENRRKKGYMIYLCSILSAQTNRKFCSFSWKERTPCDDDESNGESDNKKKEKILTKGMYSLDKGNFVEPSLKGGINFLFPSYIFIHDKA